MTFGGTIDGNFSLTVNDGGTNTFNAEIGGTTALANITTDSPGFSTLFGDVTVTGSINFLDITTANGSTGSPARSERRRRWITASTRPGFPHRRA